MVTKSDKFQISQHIILPFDILGIYWIRFRFRLIWIWNWNKIKNCIFANFLHWSITGSNHLCFAETHFEFLLILISDTSTGIKSGVYKMGFRFTIYILWHYNYSQSIYLRRSVKIQIRLDPQQSRGDCQIGRSFGWDRRNLTRVTAGLEDPTSLSKALGLNLAVLQQQWWGLHVSEKFLSGT
jgi:hypothetical protein